MIGSDARFRRSAAGFTILEILVVLSLFSLVALLSAPLIRTPPARAQLAADATRLASALRVTRAAAMAQNREMSVVIDAARRTFASPAIPQFFFDRRIEIGMAIAEPERATAFRGGIRFFPSGQSTGGDIQLRLEHAEARIHINWATGNATLER